MGVACPMMAINFLASHIFNFIEKGVLSCRNGNAMTTESMMTRQASAISMATFLRDGRQSLPPPHSQRLGSLQMDHDSLQESICISDSGEFDL
jgi:hypothetical protein